MTIDFDLSEDGKWVTFTGDQLGVLFAGHILDSTYKRKQKPLTKLAMVTTIVSSKMLESVAEAEGFHFVQTLTGTGLLFPCLLLNAFQGFKWIGNKAKDLAREGFEVPFGYEEAIGYMFGPEIRDKDGVAASVS